MEKTQEKTAKPVIIVEQTKESPEFIEPAPKSNTPPRSWSTPKQKTE